MSFESSPIFREIESWQLIYDWFKDRDDDFDAEAKHVEGILKAITLGIKLNPQEPSK